MNRKVIALTAVVSALAAGLITAAILLLWPQVSPIQAQESPQTAQYILKGYYNQIAVYETGDETPIRILDVPVSSLPYAEQSALRNGLQVSSLEELQRLIEDYTG